jgi:hypothetical protein
MTASYNFTFAARFYDQEHELLLGPGQQDNEQLRQQLEALWNLATSMVPDAKAASGIKRQSSCMLQ